MPAMRLDKLLSESTAFTRSQLKQLIKSGRVTVNGTVTTSPEYKLEPENARVCVDDAPVSYSKFYYFMLNKPAGLLSATDDRKQRTVIDLFPPELRPRLFPVGRLDKDTTGLLLVTDDGDFAHKVISPRSEIVKLYRAVTAVSVSDDDISAFARGIVLADGTRCLPAALEKCPDGSCLVSVTEGKYHQVKRMLASRGKPVIELKRLQIGGLRLDEGLAEGEFRRLTDDELCSVIKK